MGGKGEDEKRAKRLNRKQPDRRGVRRRKRPVVTASKWETTSRNVQPARDGH